MPLCKNVNPSGDQGTRPYGRTRQGRRPEGRSAACHVRDPDSRRPDGPAPGGYRRGREVARPRAGGGTGGREGGGSGASAALRALPAVAGRRPPTRGGDRPLRQRTAARPV